MSPSRFTGRVLVVAGDDDRLVQVAQRLVAAGAFVAFVANDRKMPDAHAAFRTDPAAAEAWERVAPHVEQRLGPVDAVVCDAYAHAAVESAFGPDIARRGHGGIVVLDDADTDDVVSAVADML